MMPHDHVSLGGEFTSADHVGDDRANPFTPNQVI